MHRRNTRDLLYCTDLPWFQSRGGIHQPITERFFSPTFPWHLCLNLLRLTHNISSDAFRFSFPITLPIVPTVWAAISKQMTLFFSLLVARVNRFLWDGMLVYISINRMRGWIWWLQIMSEFNFNSLTFNSERCGFISWSRRSDPKMTSAVAPRSICCYHNC